MYIHNKNNNLILFRGRTDSAPPSIVAFAACVLDRPDTRCLRHNGLILTAFAAWQVDVYHTRGVWWRGLLILEFSSYTQFFLNVKS